MDIGSILSSMVVPTFGFNWIDILIVIITIFYAVEGYSVGFFEAFVDLLSFVVSFIFGLFFYGAVAGILVSVFTIPQGFANAIGFFIVSVISEVIFNVLLKIIAKNLNPITQSQNQNKRVKKLNGYFGIIPGILSSLVIIAFILSLIVSLPFSVFLKHSVSSSKIGNLLVANTQGFSKNINNVFGGAVNDSLSFLTVEPESNQTLALNFKTTNISVDHEAEQKMLNLVNKEREARNISKLEFSEDLATIGRSHCKDMFKRGYFSHNTPEGLTPFDRMAQAGIEFNYAGENLALAPNTDLAMNGLMQSPGHKANILSANFHQVGIGVIDGGIYGQMYCQEFTN